MFMYLGNRLIISNKVFFRGEPCLLTHLCLDMKDLFITTETTIQMEEFVSINLSEYCFEKRTSFSGGAAYSLGPPTCVWEYSSCGKNQEYLFSFGHHQAIVTNFVTV